MEALAIGPCEYVVAEREVRQTAKALAHDTAGFTQSCLWADRRSVKAQNGLAKRDALLQEWRDSKAEVLFTPPYVLACVQAPEARFLGRYHALEYGHPWRLQRIGPVGGAT